MYVRALKFRALYQSIRSEGFGATVDKLKMLAEMPIGTLRGTDQFGNRYFDNPHAIPGRTRYVMYANPFDVNPASVPPEWHPWLHYTTDLTPVETPPLVPRYKKPHVATVLSQMGHRPNYIPPGYADRDEPRLGLDKYQHWQSLHDSQPSESESSKSPKSS